MLICHQASTLFSLGYGEDDGPKELRPIRSVDEWSCLGCRPDVILGAGCHAECTYWSRPFCQGRVLSAFMSLWMSPWRDTWRDTPRLSVLVVGMLAPVGYLVCLHIPVHVSSSLLTLLHVSLRVCCWYMSLCTFPPQRLKPIEKSYPDCGPRVYPAMSFWMMFLEVKKLAVPWGLVNPILELGVAASDPFPNFHSGWFQ